jgi:hypothetical protein
MSGAAIACMIGRQATVRLNAASLVATAYNPADAVTELTIDNAGLVSEAGDTPSSYSWLTEGVAADYEVVVALTSGTFSSGSGAGTFNLGTTRFWTVSQTVVGAKSAQATFAIQMAAGGATVAGPVTISFFAEVYE